MTDVLDGSGRPLGLGATIGASIAAHVAVAALMLLPRTAAQPTVPPSDPPPAAAGDTFELPAPESEASEGASTTFPAENAQPSSETAEGDAPKPRPSAAGRPRIAQPSANKPASDGSAGSSAVYGAVGDRSASDLATAFTRGFPQAASADPAWRTVPLGPTGAADVVLTISEEGHLEGSEVLGTPNAALASGIRRTLALVRARTFVAHGKITRLHVTGTVSADTVHDGLHGDVFAVGGSFAGGGGSAFFALAIGRRVDVRVRASAR